MSEEKQKAGWPAKMRREPTQAAELLERYAQGTDKVRGEDAAYSRVLARMRQPNRVGEGELSSQEPERGRAWEPSQGSHHKQRVGEGELSSQEPERGRAWEPSQGSHHKQRVGEGELSSQEPERGRAWEPSQGSHHNHPPSRALWGLALGSTALVVATLLWLFRSGHEKSPLPGPTPPVAKAPNAPPPPTPTAPVLELAPRPVPLPVGASRLPSHVLATLAEGSAATARLADGTLDIALVHGSLGLEVRPREVGQAVLVAAGRFRFTVVGTAFTLSRKPQRLDLAVSEGLVSVSREADHLATVLAGEGWSTELPGEAPRRVVPRVARRPREDCARFAPEKTQERLACYREKVRKGGPEAERAQNALARYLRDDMADPGAALAAFEAQRVRFPRGELRPEADRAIIGLLPQLGRHAEALVETQSFLDAQPDAEDRAEIRLLRGDIYRAIFRDLLRAEKEYDEGAEGGGRTADDSRFMRALCLEALGRTDEARVAYQDYLAQAGGPGSAHAAEAQRRMQRLDR
jgi:ferric-dicitrate binding protein FerR (iron transport regulator)